MPNNTPAKCFERVRLITSMLSYMYVGIGAPLGQMTIEREVLSALVGVLMYPRRNLLVGLTQREGALATLLSNA